jgi:hypothetical protein
MRFGLGLCFASLLVTVGLAQGPKNPMLVATCVNQKASYAPAETVELMVTIENRGASSFCVYRPLEWGWSGLWRGLLDATGRPVRPKRPVVAALPPPPLADRSQLVELEPGYFYGRQLKLALSDYDLKPGAYFVAFKYRSNYHAEDGFGLPILTWDDGEIVSNNVEFSIGR